ncbi:MAG: IMPACT family protein [Candidatus Acetothermia bacterium]
MNRYKTLAGESRSEIRKKGSKFVGVGFSASDLRAVQVRLEEIGDEFSDATHLPFAWHIIVDGAGRANYDNDGEPSGTAGEPILNVIEGRNLYNVAVCVARYFGGIELGTGGLVRAYGDATREVLERGRIIWRHRTESLQISYPYHATGSVMALLDSFNIRLEEIHYGEGPVAHITVPRSQTDKLKRQLAEATSGEATVRKLDHDQG